MGLSENCVTQVLMVCHHISYWSGHTWGVLYFQTHPYGDFKWDSEVSKVNQPKTWDFTEELGCFNAKLRDKWCIVHWRFHQPSWGCHMDLILVGGDWNHELDYDFPFSWECHHPNWRTPSFFRGVGWHHQPEFIERGMSKTRHGFVHFNGDKKPKEAWRQLRASPTLPLRPNVPLAFLGVEMNIAILVDHTIRMCLKMGCNLNLRPIFMVEYDYQPWSTRIVVYLKVALL